MGADDWVRLGRLLRRRRGYLGYPVREDFLRHHDTDSGSGLGRIIGALETAERTNYDDATLGRVERMYDWREGSIASVLNGGEPMPRERIEVENLLPAARAESVIAAKRWELVEMLGRVPDAALDGVRAYLTDEILAEEK